MQYSLQPRDPIFVKGCELPPYKYKTLVKAQTVKIARNL